MTLTPTDKGAMLAGTTVSILFWSCMLKLDTIARMIGLGRFVKRDRILQKMYDNKGATLILTEVVNYGTHGITNPSSTLFAFGATIVNAFFIFVGLRMWKSSSIGKQRRRVLGVRRA
jgi:hypothetical protein